MNVRPTPRFDAAMIPARMRTRPLDPRGYPIPWFVTLKDANGHPEFRVLEPGRIQEALRGERCWLCGERLGRFKSFLIGPMCAITRTISEPPQHRECSELAAKACPFMVLPTAKRREANLPADGKFSETGLKRNPGASCVWTTTSFTPFRYEKETLFQLGDPSSVSWWAEGRPATMAEVDHSIRTGLPHLYADADKEDHRTTELQRRWTDHPTPFDNANRALQDRIAQVYDKLLPGWPAPIRAEVMT